MSFKIGDKVIYPNHGLGIVAKIEEKTIFGNTEGFFHLRILSTESTVLVPVANVDNVGLRRAISDEEVEELYRLLGDGHIDNHQNWKGRFKDNSDKMRTGSIYDMADVLKSLTFLAKSKSLSFREKRMLDRAKALIVSEISEVMRIKPEAVDARVNEQLEKCFAERARAVAAGEPLPLPPPRIIPPAPPRSTMPLPSVKPMSAPAPAAAKPVTPLQARVAQKSAQAVVAPKAAAAAAGVRQLSPSPKAAAKAPLAAKPAAPAKKKAVVRQAAPARKTAPTKSVSSKKTVAKAAPAKVVARKAPSKTAPAKAAGSKKAAPKSAAGARKADGRRGSASTVRKSSPKAAAKKKASASKPAARR